MGVGRSLVRSAVHVVGGMLVGLAVAIGLPHALPTHWNARLFLDGRRASECQPRCLNVQPPDEIKLLTDLCQGIQQAREFSLLERSNSLAAEQLIRLRGMRLSIDSVVMTAYSGDYGGFLLRAVERGPHRGAVVFTFVDSRDRLVHYTYHVDPQTYNAGAAYGVARPAMRVSREELVQSGKEGEDGTVYVDSSTFGQKPDVVRVPDGEVAVALRYPDGSYSNFVLLVRSRE